MPIYKQPKSENWLIEFKVDGKRFRRSSGTPIKRIAENLERKWRQEIIEGKHQIKAPVRLTFGEAKERYWTTVTSLKGSRALSKTAELYMLNVIQSYFGKSTYLDQISSDEISRWKDAMLVKGKAPATVNRYLATTRAILNRAHSEWQALRYVPAFKLLPLDNKRVVCLSSEEELRLLKVCPSHLAPLVMCLLDTGARLSEALDMRWDDIVLNQYGPSHIIIRRSKNGEARAVPLTKRCCAMFVKLKPDSAAFNYPVFTYQNGRASPASFRQPHRAWKSALKRSGISPCLRIHDLRHTFASRLVKVGVPLFEVSKLLGHKSLNMTTRYAHLSASDLEFAIQKLDCSF